MFADVICNDNNSISFSMFDVRVAVFSSGKKHPRVVLPNYYILVLITS